MKMEKYCFILVVVTGILCVPAPGEIELPEFIESDLIAPAIPTLAGIKDLCVVIVPLGTDPNRDNLNRKKLKANVECKLEKAGIKIFIPKEGTKYKLPFSSDLKVSIEMLNLADLQQCVFHIQTSLSRAVRLKEQSGLLFKADVWKTEPIMQVVPVQSMPVKVTDVVLEQIESFICAYHVANSQHSQSSDANDISDVSNTTSRPSVKQVTAEYEYVASKNSEVFHKPDCRWAKKISPKNLVSYKGREEAIEAGKRPCRTCKP